LSREIFVVLTYC